MRARESHASLVLMVVAMAAGIGYFAFSIATYT